MLTKVSKIESLYITLQRTLVFKVCLRIWHRCQRIQYPKRRFFLEVLKRKGCFLKHFLFRKTVFWSSYCFLNLWAFTLSWCLSENDYVQLVLQPIACPNSLYATCFVKSLSWCTFGGVGNGHGCPFTGGIRWQCGDRRWLGSTWHLMLIGMHSTCLFLAVMVI